MSLPNETELREWGFTGWASLAAFGIVGAQLITIELQHPGRVRPLLEKLARSIEDSARAMRGIR